MDFKENYYFEKYEQLAVLADTQKCKTILSRNTDTNEIVVFKVMDKHGLDVYHRLKNLDNSNIVDVMDCFYMKTNVWLLKSLLMEKDYVMFCRKIFPWK